MKATVQGNENYTGLEKIVSFVIAEKTSEEDKPNVGDDSNTSTPDKDDNDNATIPPTEDKVELDISNLNPNEVNEVVIEDNVNNFDVVLKDMEALKNGQGSLNATLNNVNIKLPFSVVDSNLIDENDVVTLRLNLLTESEIIKDLKAVNKVFDFNLIINKENEGVNIHNFKDGVAEITISLSDAELEGLNKDKLKVYYYNEETNEFEAMETKVEGNDITFKTSHFSKYVIAEEIVENNVTTPEKDDTVTITPDEETNSNTNNSNTSTTTGSQGSKNETGDVSLPQTGAVVSSSVILVVALGVVLVGGIMLFRKRKYN